MERGRRKSTMERDGDRVEGRVQWNGMERGRRKSTMERDGKE